MRKASSKFNPWKKSYFQQVPYFRVKLKSVAALMQFSSEYQLWPVFSKKYKTKQQHGV